MHELIENALVEAAEKAARKRGAGLPLRIQLWNGQFIDLAGQPAITIRVRKASGAIALLRPTLSRIGKAYVEGEIEIEGSPRDAIRILDEWSMSHAKPRRWRAKRRSKRVDRRSVQYHYDVSNDFYRLFLDRQMVYSCGYFRNPQGTPGDSLDLAQEDKLDLICRKLMLKPGDRFLDIGCGWGALLRWAVKNYGVRATGITISRRQYDQVRAMIRTENLHGQAEVLYQDYRELKGEGCFDKIASIGMFEHVGIAQLPAYFSAAHRLLRDGGLMLNHGICSSGLDLQRVGSSDAGTFMEHYVFPYGELPHMSFAAREFSRQGFEIADVESLRPHYMRTLEHWLSRLEANREDAVRLAGVKRYRIWRAYFAGCAHAFERGWISVYQLLAMKQPTNGKWTLPMTRDHLLKRPKPFLAEGAQEQLVS